MEKKTKFSDLNLSKVDRLTREEQTKVRGGYIVCYDRFTGAMYFSHTGPCPR